MRRALTAAATALFVALLLGVAQAQEGLAGKWQGTTPNGTPLTFEFTVTGGDVTGTVTRGEDTVKIVEGRTSGNTFTFKATLGDQTEAVSGEFKGDDMKVWLDRQGPENAAALKRVKS